MEPELGWTPELEEQHDSAIVEMSAPAPICAAGDIPKELDVSWFTQQDQGHWPFCHAHMRTACLEYLYWVATRGQVVQYSRRFATITNLRMDGDDSRPNGASIGGSMRASQKWGEALEESFPYFGDTGYSNHIPAKVMLEADAHRIRSLAPACRSYDAMDAALTSGLVALALGFEWSTGWDDQRGGKFLDAIPRGRVRGGHALAAFGWVTRAGERWYAMHNSHPNWGQNRKMYLAPDVWDRLLIESRFGACLVSDLELKDAPPARPWDWLESANFSNGMQLNLV
jgi:hypothetical protein